MKNSFENEIDALINRAKVAFKKRYNYSCEDMEITHPFSVDMACDGNDIIIDLINGGSTTRFKYHNNRINFVSRFVNEKGKKELATTGYYDCKMEFVAWLEGCVK